MRKPENPPDWINVLAKRGADAIQRVFQNGTKPEIRQFVNEMNEKYLHWDKLRFHPMPEILDAIEAWGVVKVSRMHRQLLPITFNEREKLTYMLPPQHQEWLQIIDKEAGWGGATIKRSMPENRRYLVNSLMEEAIASSQLEGAVTTRKRAKELLRSNRRPRNDAEKMVLNNYKAILEIRELKDQKLTPDMLCHLQKVLTNGMLSDPSASGRFRTSEENVVVADVTTNDELYIPPSAEVVQSRIKEICNFANAKTTPFVHPVVKAIALHFAIGFVHPFVDGNGRTARAIFYWYLLKQGYSSFEFVPVSRIFLNGPSKYSRAYLYTETDEGDLTYFIHFNLRSIITAINDLHKYLEAQSTVLHEAMELAESHPELNYRQLELVKLAIHHPSELHDTQTYAGKYRISFPTARADLVGLEKAGLLVSLKKGRTTYFKPAGDLIKKLKATERTMHELFDDKPKRVRIKTVTRQKREEQNAKSKQSPTDDKEKTLFDEDQ